MKVPGSGIFLLQPEVQTFSTTQELLRVVFSLPFPLVTEERVTHILNRYQLTMPNGAPGDDMCQSSCAIKLWVQFYPLNSFRRGEQVVPLWGGKE